MIKKYLLLYMLCIPCITLWGVKRRHGKRNSKKTVTMPLSTFNAFVDRRNELLRQVKDAEPAANNPNDYAHIVDLYDQLIDFAESKQEQNKWGHNKKLNIKRNSIMQIIYDPQSQPLDTIDPKNLRRLKILETQYKKLRDTYRGNNSHYHRIGQKIDALQRAHQTEAYTLDQAELYNYFHEARTAQNPVASYRTVIKKAKKLFDRQADRELQDLPGINTLALQSCQQSWQLLAAENANRHSLLIGCPNAPARITPNQHRYHAISTQIALVRQDRELKPNERACQLAQLYTALATICDDEQDKAVAQAAKSYYLQLEKRLLLQHALKLLSDTDNVEHIVQSINITKKLAQRYPTFHPSSRYYEHKVQALGAKKAYMQQDKQQLEDIKQATHNNALRCYAQLLLYRLGIEQDLDELKKDACRNATSIRQKLIHLLSTYDKKEPEHAHIVNEIAQLDLKQKLSEHKNGTQHTHQMYLKACACLQQLKDIQPENHPNRVHYKQELKGMQLHKRLADLQNQIEYNEQNELTKVRAYTLEQLYDSYLETYRSLQSTKTTYQDRPNADVEDLELQKKRYHEEVKQYQLREQLKNVRVNDPANYELKSNILNVLLNLSISLSDHTELQGQKNDADQMICKQSYQQMLEHAEKNGDKQACIKAIKSLRKLSVLSLQEILLLENKLDRYQSEG